LIFLKNKAGLDLKVDFFFFFFTSLKALTELMAITRLINTVVGSMQLTDRQVAVAKVSGTYFMGCLVFI